MALVSVNAEDLAAVLELAILTESRTNAEQRSLLAAAQRCDRVRNAKVSSNVEPAKGAMWRRVPGWTGDADEGLERIQPESVLERWADHSRVMDQDEGERRIKPSWERKR